MINSRKLAHLNFDFGRLVAAWLAECGKQGLDILVVCTYRDNEFQNYLYAQGRTREGKICTNAKGGESLHNAMRDGQPASLALDFCIMKGKQCDWDDIEGFTKAGLIAESLGLVWAGRWRGKIKEVGHIQAF